MSEDIEKITAFFKTIGLPFELKEENPYQGSTFLDEVWYEKGAICFTRDVHPGDLLHDAGHLAVTPESLRPLMDTPSSLVRIIYSDYTKDPVFIEACEAYYKQHKDNPDSPEIRALIQSGETETIAWSYAAAVAAGVDPSIPFQNGGDEIAELEIFLSTGQYFGVHGLFHGGMLASKKEFPKMSRWLQIH